MGSEDIFSSYNYKCLVHVPHFLFFVVSVKQTKQAKVDILLSSAYVAL